MEVKGEALALLEKTGEQLEWVKMGLQMFNKYGPPYVQAVANPGKKIFLDLKLPDIPNTVAKAVQSVGELPIQMLTIHTCGGEEMMERALKAQEQVSPQLQLLGMTVLTSMDAAGLRLQGINQSPVDRVMELASQAKQAGMSGLVCSTLEVESLKRTFGNQFKFVTPGVRLEGSDSGDQKRVMTPSKAAMAGSDYIVVGRPIYQAEDPTAAVRFINFDLSE